MTRRATFVLLLAFAAAACSRGRGTPEATFETVRAAVTSGDPKLLYEVHALEGRAWARQCAREWKAMIERGDPPETVLGQTGVTPDEVRTSDVPTLAGKVLRTASPLMESASWYSQARLEPEKTVYDGPDAARIVLSGMDGRTREIWLTREDGLWAVDGARTWRQR